MRDPYQVLGLSRNAAPDQVKAAWRAAAKAVHPDQNPDDPLAVRRFTEVGHAYDVLKDPERRSRYDRAREAAEARQRDQTIMERRARERAEELAKAQAAAAEASNADADTHEDLISRIFGGRKPPEPQVEPEAGPEDRGPSFMDAMQAAINEARQQPDPEEPVTSRTSPARDLLNYLLRRLTGQVAAPDKAPDLVVEVEVSLEDLFAGRAQMVTLPDGRQLEIPLEPGTKNHDAVRIEGQGHRLAGMKRGDVVAMVRLLPHPWFRAEGYDLVTFHALDIENAVLGCQASVETLDGTAKITIPEWSGSDHCAVVEGQGLLRADGSRGNLIVEMRVMLWDFPDQKVVDLMASLRDGLYL